MNRLDSLTLRKVLELDGLGGGGVGPAGPPGEDGVQVAPLSTVLFVDQGSTADTQDGSLGLPFTTIAAAIAAGTFAGHPHVTGYYFSPLVLLIAPGDYSGEPAINWNQSAQAEAGRSRNLVLRNLEGSQAIRGAPRMILPAITVNLGSVQFESGGGPYSIGGELTIEGAVLGGAVNCGQSGSKLNLLGCDVQVLLTATEIYLAECYVRGATLTTTGAEFSRCKFNTPSSVLLGVESSSGFLTLDEYSNYFWELSSSTHDADLTLTVLSTGGGGGVGPAGPAGPQGEVGPAGPAGAPGDDATLSATPAVPLALTAAAGNGTEAAPWNHVHPTSLTTLGTEAVSTDLIPQLQAGAVVNTGGNVTHDVAIAVSRRYSITAEVWVEDAAGDVLYTKSLLVKAHRKASGNAIIVVQSVLDDDFSSAGFTFLATVSGTDVRFTLANASGTNRPYSLLVGHMSADKP